MSEPESTPKRFEGCSSAPLIGTASRSRARRPGQRMRGEQGYVLAMTALLLLPLLVFVSFAVDAGAWYAQASRMQRAADAAALAAVVWLPNTTNAANARNAVARQNGFATGVTGSVAGPTSYQVTIAAEAPRFFSGTFTTSNFDLTRSATAEFNKPVPMGSPTNKMGNDVANCPQFQPSQTAPCGPQPMLWSSIQGPYELFANGDPYTTKCARNYAGPYDAAGCSGANFNTLYRTTGYSFAMDVKQADVGKPMQFQVWDAGSYPRTVGSDSTTLNPATHIVDRATTSTTSRTVTRTTGGTGFLAADVGKRISGTGMPVAATVTGYTNVNTAQISANAASAGTNRTLTVGQGTVDTVTMTNGSNILTRPSGTAVFLPSDLGKLVTGTGIAANTTITGYTNGNRVTLSAAANSSGTGRTVTVSEFTTTVVTYDCNVSAAPFNASPYLGIGTLSSQNCQTGDQGTAPFELQIFDNDGQDLTVDFSTPLPACRMYVGPSQAGLATYKNKWVSVCTITPSQTGVYPVRVKSSAITGVTDVGGGYNQFSMRLQGATTSRLYALDDLSIWTNTPSSDARFYLADIGPEHAGKRLQLDLYDPGDGSGDAANYTMQVLAPPSGAPNPVPTTGAVLPANSCRYNDLPSATKGPDVTAPNGNNATNCIVTTRVGSNNKYNNNWLRIEIKIPDNYNCTTDCWWSIRYDFGGTSGIPTDRTVWSLKVVGDPVHLID